MEVVHARCAGMDISKTDAKVCVRVQGAGRRKTSTEVTEWAAKTSKILELADYLLAQKVTCVVMEATGNYWKIFVRHEAHCSIPRAAGADSEGGWRV